MTKVSITSLGCPRNLVDSEVMLGSLRKAGFNVADVEDGVDIHIINTCSFIESARAESIETILEASELKKEGKIKHLVVCGCLPQLSPQEIAKELPEVDLFLGTSDLPKIKDAVRNITKARSSVSNHLDYIYDGRSPRLLLTPRHYAYIKISEGCSNHCSYCVISRLRGRFRSRTIESVLEEIKSLSSRNTLKEIELIGQDTTLFGIDRYGESKFTELLRKISALENSVRWVRILYTHPAHYTDDLISAIRDEERICKYLDLPIQHISDKILRRMNRQTKKKDIIKLIEDLRRLVPDVVIRTSIIVGFPGESDKDFEELLDFVREARFERLGAFIYSREEGTRAAGLSDQIPDDVKKGRFDELMRLQLKISDETNRSFLDRTLEVLIDEKVEGESDKFLGRTQGDAPEVDGTVYVTGKDLRVGEFYNVRITDTLEYDLVGERI